MQRPFNCNIYTSRPPAKQRMARLAWDYFSLDEEGRTPGRLWFVRDTPPWSYWIVEWKSDTDGERDYDEVMPQELRDWHEEQARCAALSKLSKFGEEGERVSAVNPGRKREAIYEDDDFSVSKR